MSEWKTYRLGEICKNVVDYRGKTPAKLGADWATSGYRVFSAKNIKTGHIVQTDSIRYVDEDLYRKWMKDEVERGDIIITSEAPLGEVYYWDSDEKIVLGQRLFGLKINKVCYSKYLYYYMTTVQFQSELRNRATGTTVVGLRQPELLKCTVSLPPLDEQRKIAGILGALDDKIELNRRINANLEEQAQALFKSWFVDFEPFKDGPFVDSELGKIPKGWRVGVASDFYNITIGKTPPRKEQFWFSKNCKDIVWVSISDMGNSGPFIGDSSEYLTMESIKKFNICVVPIDTVLLSFKLTIGRVAIADKALATNEAIAHFRTTPDNLEYTYLALKDYEFSSLGSTSSIATAINSKIIKSMPWIMPNENILKQFHKILSPMLNRIRCNIQESNHLSTLRDALLPKLMKGEIKIN